MKKKFRVETKMPYLNFAKMRNFAKISCLLLISRNFDFAEMTIFAKICRNRMMYLVFHPLTFDLLCPAHLQPAVLGFHKEHAHRI
jgi:hypothetical protein